ncbi:MAG: hypothetical protein ACHQZS_06710 [Candidatus Binatales bacterium]
MDTDSRNLHIAEMAHVFAARNKGPRANVELTEEERGAYENLILLCPTCHTIVDKAPEDFPDDVLAEWKRSHAERVAAAFGAVEYGSRQAARQAIEPALAENRVIFDEYGPENEYKFDPESELAKVWQRKVRSRILPNNRKVLAILDANRRHLRGDEPSTLEEFRQHVDDLEAKHLGEGATAVGRRFPHGMRAILTERSNA